MKRDEVREALEAMAIHCDMIAHSYEEMARLAGVLKLTAVTQKVDESAPPTFRRISLECRKQAEKL